MFASMLLRLISGKASDSLRYAKTKMAALALAVLCGSLGGAFLIVGLYLWTARRFGAIEAAIGFGIGFLLMGAGILAIHRMVAEKRRRRRRLRQGDSEFATLAVASALAALPTLLRGRGPVAIVLTPLLALVAYEIFRENRRDMRSGPDEDEYPPS